MVERYPKKWICFYIITAIIFGLLCRCISGATYYIDAADGNDSNPGSSQSPWKTIARAYPTDSRDPKVNAGDTVYIRNGTYGTFNLGNYSGSSWIIYAAEAGHLPHFTTISINNSAQQNVYIRFDGIDVNVPRPDPMPPDDGLRHYTANCMSFKNTNHIDVRNSSIKGAGKYLTSRGIATTNCDNVTVYHCDMSNVVGATNFDKSKNLRFLYNHIHNTSEGSGVRILPGSTGAIIEGNHIEGCFANSNDPYFPDQDPSEYHRGSGIAIRASDAVVRNNIIHNGYTQALMFYQGYGVYHNMVVENNLFYDSGRIALYNCGNNIVVRNNTFIGNVAVEGTTKYKILQKYNGGCPFGCQVASGYNGSDIQIYNNIMIQWWGVSESGSLDEDYNLIWVYGGTNGYQHSKGDHTVVTVWKLQVSPYTLFGYPNRFQDIGFRGATAQYNYAVDGIQPFFVNPGFYFGAVGNHKDCRKTWDYHLATGSPGINFGASQVATYTEVLNGAVTGPSQPPDSLGSLSADGFITDDGPARNATRHSVGCYEYVSE